MFEEMLEGVEKAVRPVLEHLGFRLIEREYVSQHGGWVLRLYIEREGGGVTIGDCQRVSQAIGDLLEVEGLMRGRYSLEVSSPGIHRPLRYAADFERFTGQSIRVKTRYSIAGRSHFQGLLKGIEHEVIRLLIDGNQIEIPLAAVTKANLIGQLKEDYGSRNVS